MAKNKKVFFKRGWFILILIFVAIGVIRCGNNKNATEKRVEYRWPDSELASMIPKPDSKYGKVSMESESSFLIDIYDISSDQYEDYIDACKNSGFTVDYNKFDGFYSADNEAGYSLNLSYDGDDEELSISLFAPADDQNISEKDINNDDTLSVDNDKDTEQSETADDDKQEEDEYESTEASEAEASEESNDSELIDGMRPEFKEAMDSYEAFYEEYCEVVKQYSNNPSDLALLGKYTELMSKAIEVDEKFKAWDEKEMNAAEAKYYIEVSGRISKKMIEVGMQ